MIDDETVFDAGVSDTGVPPPNRFAAPPGRPGAYNVVPDGPLGHNPDADAEELLRVRANFNLAEHLAGRTESPKAPEPVNMNRDTVLELCDIYGLVLMDDPRRATGHKLNLTERLALSEKLVVGLREENSGLLTRATLAEASAANAVRELGDLKAARAATPPEDNPVDTENNPAGPKEDA